MKKHLESDYAKCFGKFVLVCLPSSPVLHEVITECKADGKQMVRCFSIIMCSTSKHHQIDFRHTLWHAYLFIAILSTAYFLLGHACNSSA